MDNKNDPVIDLCGSGDYLLHGIMDPVLIISKDFKILKANKAFLKQFNLKQENVIGKGCHELIHHYDAPCLPKDVLCPLREAMKSEEPNTIEHVHHTPKGTLYFDVTAYAVKDEKGKVLYFIYYAKNITKRKKLHEELQASELKYKTIFESSKDAIMLLTPTKGFFRGNPATIKMFGCTNEEEFDALAPASLSPEYQPDGKLSSVKAQEMMAIAMKEGSHYFEWIHRRVNGEEFPATVLLTKTTFESRDILQATVRDISEQKRTEQLLKDHEERLQFAIETAQIGMWEYDIKNDTAWRSPHHDKIFGHPKMLPEWNYEIFISHIVPEHKDEMEELYQNSMYSNKNWSYECKIKRKDGQIRWIWGAGKTIFDEHGRPSKLIGVVQDITDKKVKS